MNKNLEKPLVIRDEIHGDMVFDAALRPVIDHECFQRLRFIKQLGLAEYVFPCANHTRFQHSLGASYLASQYFTQMLSSWMNSPFTFEGTLEKTRFFSARTFSCVEAVVRDVRSEEYWRKVISLAGLLHDVGHGPWSHTFEYLGLEQDFSQVIARLEGTAMLYFSTLSRKLEHEDLSVLYLFHILSDLEKRNELPGALDFFLPVAMLIHRKMALGEHARDLEKELGRRLSENGIKGGIDFHRLLRPLVSGPFDVDRIDYIQRDGRNCGVSLGGIEWRRIVSKLIPCLADHQGDPSEPKDVVLISNFKNQHVLDDFVFSLFQMYAQVYMHPKIVGLESLIRDKLDERFEARRLGVINFESHRKLTDEKFRELLTTDLGVPEADDLLLRKPGARFEVASYPENSGMGDKLVELGFIPVGSLDRPMMKDSAGVFLHSANNDGYLCPWLKVSPVAQHFYSIHYAPGMWVRWLS